MLLKIRGSLYLLAFVLGLSITLFFIPSTTYAACGATGTESPNNAGWCYTGASYGGGCVVVNCADQVIGKGSTWRVEDPTQTSIEFVNTETDKNPSVIDEDLTSFSVAVNNNTKKTFFGTIFNSIKNLFNTVKNNVKSFSQRKDLSYSKAHGDITLKDNINSNIDMADDTPSPLDISCPGTGTESPHNPGWCYTGASYGGGCVVVNCADQVIGIASTFRVEIGTELEGGSFNNDPVSKDPSIIDEDITSFRYGDTSCDISISAVGIITERQKTEIGSCLNDPTLSILENEKLDILKTLGY